MPHRTRLIVFYTFVILFLIAGTSVLLYSSGWRIDLETGKVQKIGAIYIKANVRDLTIKINDKTYPDDSGILQSGTLISNLLPKTYKVEISKQGYLPYHKTVTVRPSLVEELLNVQLIPETLDPTTIAQTKGTKFVDATGSADRIILQDAAKGTYYLYDKARASSTINLTLAINNVRRTPKIRHIMFVPFKSTQFIIEDATGLKLFDSEKRTIDQLLKGSLVTWTIKNSAVIGVETIEGQKPADARAHRLFSFNLIFKTKTLLDDINGQISTTTSITALDASDDAGTLAFTDAEGGLFASTAKDKTLRRIAENVNAFSCSPDGKKIAVLTRSGELSAVFVEDFNSDIRKKKGDAIRIESPQMNDLEKIQWYADSYHLFMVYPTRITLTELDDRKPLNTFPILGRFDDYRYDPGTKSVLHTDEGAIKAIRIEK